MFLSACLSAMFDQLNWIATMCSRAATNLDAIAITVSYMLIVTMANAVGVITVMVLSSCGVERVGAPPVVQVLISTHTS